MSADEPNDKILSNINTVSSQRQEEIDIFFLVVLNTAEADGA